MYPLHYLKPPPIDYLTLCEWDKFLTLCGSFKRFEQGGSTPI